jgi:hypothetical protein
VHVDAKKTQLENNIFSSCQLVESCFAQNRSELSDIGLNYNYKKENPIRTVIVVLFQVQSTTCYPNICQINISLVIKIIP